jgi:hypothetical protein
LHGLIGVGLIGLISKLHKWDESAMFFDGSSLGEYHPSLVNSRHFNVRASAAYVFAIAIYLTVIVPSLRTIVMPVENVDTRDDQVEAMRILAAGNTIIMVLLGAILTLQV